ncbi:hypothetical protein T4A_13337 [Trichinella pseudospiralis]|uniref:Uncharacterized protein n=1 Tax=Trichinella pseudospiralis TaxID=6337 RepID=A0A0V1DRL4_TRIPS|nr:hypothetical protein T4A_1575 [Trichinella pseudospiralis]KRY64233.1 hypothetical protein T4A_13337 [Trichinella pseudospiralis]
MHAVCPSFCSINVKLRNPEFYPYSDYDGIILRNA